MTMDGETTVAVVKDEPVHVLNGRTRLVVGRIPCVGVITDAEIRVRDAAKTTPLGVVARVDGGVFIDRKDGRCTLGLAVEEAAEAARKSAAELTALAERVRRIKEVRAKHPIREKRARKAVEQEMLGRAADRKAGRTRAKEIADCRMTRCIYDAAELKRRILNGEKWDLGEAKVFHGLSRRANLVAGLAAGSLFKQRFVANGHWVRAEFFGECVGKWVCCKNHKYKTATAEGAAELARLLTRFVQSNH